jgi:hypothetical protein
MSYASVSLCKPCTCVMESIQDARAMLKENEAYLNPKPKARGGGESFVINGTLVVWGLAGNDPHFWYSRSPS